MPSACTERFTHLPLRTHTHLPLLSPPAVAMGSPYLPTFPVSFCYTHPTPACIATFAFATPPHTATSTGGVLVTIPDVPSVRRSPLAAWLHPATDFCVQFAPFGPPGNTCHPTAQPPTCRLTPHACLYFAILPDFSPKHLLPLLHPRCLTVLAICGVRSAWRRRRRNVGR